MALIEKTSSPLLVGVGVDCLLSPPHPRISCLDRSAGMSLLSLLKRSFFQRTFPSARSRQMRLPISAVTKTRSRATIGDE